MARHDTDLVSLSCGLLFAAVGAVMLAGERLALSWDWLAPAVAIGFGAIFIAAGWRRRAPTPDPEIES